MILSGESASRIKIDLFVDLTLVLAPFYLKFYMKHDK